MFGNFLYFIVALLIYATYQPAAMPRLPLYEALGFFIAISALFAVFTWMVFKKLEDRLKTASPGDTDRAFESLLTRQSIIAIGIFALDIYGLELAGYLHRAALIQTIPTLGALVFLALFIGYLCIIWASAYNLHERLYKTGISRRNYVFSNISFSVPVLLPWLCLSTVADIINLLPFEPLRSFLNSTWGQFVYFLLFLFIIAIFGPALIQLFWGCKPLKRSDIREKIEDICRRAGVAYREILVWPLFGGRMITAGVLGLVSRFRYILVTPALLRYLSPDEIEAVMAHEIGHVKHKHLLFYLFFFAGYLVISFAALDLLAYGSIYIQMTAGLAGYIEPGNQTFVSIIFSIAMITIFLVYFRFVFGYFMRNFERQADIYIYNIMDSAAPMISTFHKIAASSGQSPEKPNWHHFSISERIGYLRKCEQDTTWINAHHRKIRTGIAIYVIAILSLGWFGYNLHFGTDSERVSQKIAIQVLENRIEKEPQNPDLHVMLADLYYFRKNLAEAQRYYQNALSIDNGDVRALNNLAWLYATSPEKSKFYKPEQALELAKRAAQISSEPHALDTLAESYFINGMVQKAIETEELALSKAGANRRHYRKQLEKYKKAAHKKTP
ncbi:MAG: M48 family metalloprotease [Desulfobacteraceae bacterium]|nr:M48 family metalloprotease [Desulfobacteraceae bacterium]